MRTIKEWFMSVKDEEIRSNLLESMDLRDCDTTEPSFTEALRGSFIWAESKQGNEYWVKIFDNPPSLNYR